MNAFTVKVKREELKIYTFLQHPIRLKNQKIPRAEIPQRETEYILP